MFWGNIPGRTSARKRRHYRIAIINWVIQDIHNFAIVVVLYITEGKRRYFCVNKYHRIKITFTVSSKATNSQNTFGSMKAL